MAEESKPKPANVREAFCRRYRCKPAEFERKLFFKALRIHARLLMPFIGWFRPHSFNADWSIVDVMGRVRTASEMDERISEYNDWNLIDRGRRRRWLFLRISSSKLKRIVTPLLKTIEPIESPVPTPAVPVPISITPTAPSVNGTSASSASASAAPALRAATVRAAAHRQADLEVRIRELEEENARLREIVAQDAIELSRFRGERR